jgi:hypothetical protein
MFMQNTPPLSPLARFSQIMAQAREMIGRRLNPPLLLRDASLPPMNPSIAECAWRRLRRAETLLLALAARFRAGTLRPSKPALAPRRTSSARRLTPGPVAPLKTRIPRHFGWLINQIPNQIVAPAQYLRMLLAEPELREILAASPRAGRILAPACHMLGIEKELLSPNLVGRISEAQSAVATITHPDLPDAPPQADPSAHLRYGPPPYFWPWIPDAPPPPSPAADRLLL